MNLTDFPPHKCSLTLTHNDHRTCYESVESCVRDRSGPVWKDEESKQRAIDTDEIWELQWYPRTPVCFKRVAAPTLEEVLALAKTIQ